MNQLFPTLTPPPSLLCAFYPFADTPGRLSWQY